jgi:hypothetical protein
MSQRRKKRLSNPEKSGHEVYSEWFHGLPKNDQIELVSKGLGPEDPDGRIDSNYVFEVQQSHQAFGFTEDNNFDDPLPLPQRTYTQDEVESIIVRVVMAMQLTEVPEVLFQARCILIAFGIGEPPTETELARLKGCSRQFVSKKVKRIQQLFNLSPSQYMRSEAACKSYADAWHKSKRRREYNDDTPPSLDNDYESDDEVID